MLKQTLLPAEWSPHAGTLLTWPHRYSDWRPLLDEVDETYTVLASQIGNFETVVIACYDAVHRNHVQTLLADKLPPERMRLYIAPSNDTWARDYGPITVYCDGRPLMLDFRFNGWGGKFSYELDDRVCQLLSAAGAFGAAPVKSVPLILEGGSIESDGQGTLLSTRQCLLSPTRNNMSRAELESRLAPLLGIRRFLWLDDGFLMGDDTDGHIDTLARFCDSETIAYQSCDNPADEHFRPLRAMEAQLRHFR
ncbi:MAG: agmatine deiminase family protein, partial [Reinekea sp.]|nr:agmatine deiminase family protein [Reinekea sp.]